MSLYIRLHTNFWTHRKTAKLRSLLGNDAYWLPPRLWSYAAENQPDGDFSKYSPEELALLLGYLGDAQAMLEALQQACFMVGMNINDWSEHNGYHHTFSERAKKAAEARWAKESTKEKDKKGNERKGKEQALLEHAPSINEPKKESLTDEDFMIQLKPLYPGINIDSELLKMRAWLLTPRGHNRKLTRKFIVNWLSKCDSTVELNGNSQVEKKRESSVWEKKQQEEAIVLELNRLRADTDNFIMSEDESGFPRKIPKPEIDVKLKKLKASLEAIRGRRTQI